MVIVYESKRGFTKRYAGIIAEKTGLRALAANEISQVDLGEEILFLGWIKVGKIQGLSKLGKYNVKAVCASGTGRTAEPDAETVIAGNGIGDKTFFYLRGGCPPLREIKGMDKVLLSLFVKMLKKRANGDEKTEEAISIIENGYDGVREENILPVLDWINTRQ